MTRIVETMLESTAKSLAALRRRVSNVRYGKPGIILFDFDGVTYQAKEPPDVLPVGSGEASLKWALRQYLDGAKKAE